MTKTLFNIICLWIIVFAFTGWWVAQNKVNKAERIIEIDQEIAELKSWILINQNWYKISMEASEECSESFIKDALKEHEEADKKRDKIEKLENEKAGLIESR